MSSERIDYYDIVKGFAIWLVVLGHCIQTFGSDPEHNKLFLLIYAFHMPLFMMVSGKFFISSCHKYNTSQFLKKKFNRLYLPSLFWGLINLMIIGGGKLLHHEPIEFDYFAMTLLTGMWFLTILFIFNIIGFAIEKTCPKFRYHIWFIVWFISNLLPCIWMRNETVFLLPFFVVAILFSKNHWEKCGNLIGVVSIVVFIIMLQFYSFDMSLYKMTSEFFTIQYHYYAAIRFCIGFSGCLSTIVIFKLIKSSTILGKILIYLGNISLPIYVIHQNFLNVNEFSQVSTDNILYWLIISIIIIFASIAVYKICTKSKTLGLLMFGEK